MNFIVIFVALLIERFFDWSHLRHWHWYAAYQQTILRKIPGKPPFLSLAMIVLPLVIITALLAYFLDNLWFGFGRLFFDLILFIYCLGPQNLWADTFASINSLVQGDAQFAADKLKMTFGVTETATAESMHAQLLNAIFIEANRRVFAIVFWFVVLGPAGAVLYRSIALAAASFPKQEVNSELEYSARAIESVLDWLPIRIFTFIFALGGHFTRVLSCWRKRVLQGISSNEAMITECGDAAISDDQGQVAQDGSAEKNAISLLDRVFLIVLVLIAIEAFLF